ncbi:MAG: 3-isopropylmalate dehydrogenase [Gammaproteobacteria bacterium]|nr:3-isopropylmalate dehydrogenase [Gammaproteobacteria bacterium]
MKKQIVVLPGDGVGPEVTAVAVEVIAAIGAKYDHALNIEYADIGGIAIDNHNDPLPADTLQRCQAADAILLGAVGGPKWSNPGATVRPEQGLLKIRAALGLFANLRPVKPYASLAHYSPLRADRVANVDVMIVRELTGGIYFGDRVESNELATDTCSYSADEVRRIVRVAGGLARTRRQHLVSVDKANVLATSRLWRNVTSEVMRTEFPDVELEHLLVDAAAMHLLQRPADFDVMVTENLFGDILTDEASVLSGSIGLLPSASINASGVGLYEPIHGSAPDIAGQGIANPYGTVASVAMMLRHSFGMTDEAATIETAIDQCLEAGHLTADLVRDDTALSTQQVGSALCAAIDAL